MGFWRSPDRDMTSPKVLQLSSNVDLNHRDDIMVSVKHSLLRTFINLSLNQYQNFISHALFPLRLWLRSFYNPTGLSFYF